MGGSAYKEAGVDIHEAANLVDRIKPHIKRTNRSGVMSGLGGFGALFDLKASGYTDPVLVSGTDGVGTKLMLAIETNSHDTIGIDAVAMCVNDIVVQGAEPLFFLDYFATGRLKNDTAEAVIAGIANGCEQAGCALVGGETAEMPGMYADGDYDIAGFAVGAVNREDMITGDAVRVGDMVLGLASSGVHSNGFSLVRHVLKQTGLTYENASPFEAGKTLGQSLITPTRIYVKSILKALKEHKGAIHAMAHITGGGFTENIPRVLPETCAVEIDTANWPLPPLFQWLATQGNLSADDLADTFNCGIGMVVICNAAQADALKASFEASGEQVYEIGQVVARGADNASGITVLNRETAWPVRT